MALGMDGCCVYLGVPGVSGFLTCAALGAVCPRPSICCYVVGVAAAAADAVFLAALTPVITPWGPPAAPRCFPPPRPSPNAGTSQGFFGDLVDERLAAAEEVAERAVGHAGAAGRCDTFRAPDGRGQGQVRRFRAGWYCGTTASASLLPWVSRCAVPGLLAFLVTKPGRGP
ncbi:hypothetical protein ACFY6U_10170 [Streptomyces sp. NPDC013157]|uniref:hypothetical protein n=1 Tax=Streptomyces sp. NPDC013157 TaxID=3364861 RepID=UPI0036C3DBA7